MAVQLLTHLVIKYFMKHLIIIITIIFISFCNVYCQETEIQSAVNKWQGIWKGKHGNDSVILHIIQTVSPAEKDIKINNYIGMYGWHTIKSKKEIIESSQTFTSTKWNENCTITGALNGTSDTLHLVVKDITRNRLLGAYLISKKDNVTVLKTWLKETWRNDDKVYPEGQTFPREIVLIRH